MSELIRIKRNNRNQYRKKDKRKYSVDLSIVNFLTAKTPLSKEVYPKTSSIIDSFNESIDAKRERRKLLSQSKNRLWNNTNKDLERASCCLTILSNINVPTQVLAKALYEENLDYDEYEKHLIDRINNYRHELKKMFGKDIFKTAKKKDELTYKYISIGNINNRCVSFDETIIDFYKKVFKFWNSDIVVIDKKKYSWDQIFDDYKDETSKPNPVRFINQFCDSYNYSRSNSQIYLIVYNSPKCFTKDDLLEITSGKGGFLSILSKIKILTKK